MAIFSLSPLRIPPYYNAMNLSDLFPPIIADAVRARRHRFYPSWQSAAEAAGSYLDDLVNRFRADRMALRPVSGDCPTSVLHLSALNLSAPVVTDFGGAAGDAGVDFLAAFPAGTYVVVENSSMVEIMSTRQSIIQFTNSIPPECDIFFSSGTLQYIADPMGALAAGFASAKSSVVLTRNSFSETEFFRVQRSRLFENGSGPLPAGYTDIEISYPHRTVNERDVFALAKKYGFRCVARLEQLDGIFPYKNLVYGKHIVFRR